MVLDEDNQERQNALSDLQEQLSQEKLEASQQQQQSQQNSGSYYNWPFGFGY